MAARISRAPPERNILRDYYRAHPDPAVRLRAHLILRWADGRSGALLTAVLFTSRQTIARGQRRFAADRVEGRFGRQRGSPARTAARGLTWVTERTPRTFGLFRSRWSCATVVLLLWQEHQLRVSRETLRRWLHRHERVWRRPRPVIGPKDPRRDALVADLRRQMAPTPDDETWVFMDEVDVNLNPKIGPLWMRRGQQAEVITPGDNAKRYVAGSQHGRTGAVIRTPGERGQGRNAAWFVRHLEELRCRLRRDRRIHVRCDNAQPHDCRRVVEYLQAHGDRLVIHSLPKRAPECNPIERVWWHLHDEITRNRSCPTMQELLALVLG